MPGLGRAPTRMVAGGVVVLLIFIVLFYHHSEYPSPYAASVAAWKAAVPARKHDYVSEMPAFSGGQQKHLPHNADGLPFQDAHTIKDADEITNHVKALLEEEALLMVDIKRPCFYWPEETMKKLQFQFSKDEMNMWTLNETEPQEIVWQRLGWTTFWKENRMEWMEYRDKFQGRGIVTVASSKATVERLGVVLRQLTKLGSKLPVQLFHWSTDISTADQQFLSKQYHDITFTDLADQESTVHHPHPPPPTGEWGRFNYKTSAVLNSKFAEVLLLDSDNIPLRRPDDLFDSDLYNEYGTIFWPDIARTRPENPIWAITNTFCREDEYEIESGQLMVNKARFWYHLQMAAYFNDQVYFQKVLLGDKDMFRFAWHTLRTKYGKPPNWITSVGVVHPTEEDPEGQKYCGHSYVQRGPDGEPSFLHGALLQTFSPTVLKYFLDNGGIYQAFKRSQKGDNNTKYPEPSRYFFDEGTFSPQLAGQPAWQCMDLPDIWPADSLEISPGLDLDSLLVDLNGWWVLEAGNQHKWESEISKQMQNIGTLGKIPAPPSSHHAHKVGENVPGNTDWMAEDAAKEGMRWSDDDPAVAEAAKAAAQGVDNGYLIADAVDHGAAGKEEVNGAAVVDGMRKHEADAGKADATGGAGHAVSPEEAAAAAGGEAGGSHNAEAASGTGTGKAEHGKHSGEGSLRGSSDLVGFQPEAAVGNS